MYSKGWYQVAFERDLTKDLTAADLGPTRLVVARMPTGVRAFDADCPHRGAHLAIGGRLEDGAIVCPFHGYRIALGWGGDGPFCVREYRTLVIGGMVFVRLSDSHENGLTALLEELDKTHYFVPGFEMSLRTSPEMVIENGFDSAHFKPVHAILNEPRFRIRPSLHGELTVEGVFELPPRHREARREGAASVQVPFVARAFSPGLIVSDLAGETPYSVITASTPTAAGGCVLRLTLALPAPADGPPPDQESCRRMLRDCRAGIEKDQVIWENMSFTREPHFTAQDAAVLVFRNYCQQFKEHDLS